MIVCQLGSWNSSVADVGRRLRLDYSILGSTSAPLTAAGHAALGSLRVVVALVGNRSSFVIHVRAPTTNVCIE